MNKKEGTSVVLAFAGFAVLVLVFRGTWANAWHAMLGQKSSAKSSGAGAGATAATGALAYPVQAGTLAFAGVTAGRPGAAPAATTATVAQRPAPIVHSAQGDVAGRPGENRFSGSTPQEIASKGGTWAFKQGVGWQGPGVYEARKFTYPDGTSTELVKVG